LIGVVDKSRVKEKSTTRAIVEWIAKRRKTVRLQLNRLMVWIACVLLTVSPAVSKEYLQWQKLIDLPPVSHPAESMGRGSKRQ